MRIIRFMDAHGSALYASLQPDGSALQIEGDVFGVFEVTHEPASIERLLAPLEPVNVIAIGLNYRRHAEESGTPPPEHPVVFMKATSAIQNPGEPIMLPNNLRSTEVDYECELAVVIGSRCRDVRREDALDYVLGYTCANDVSARDWQLRLGGGQWWRGESFDTFLPLGPCLAFKDEIPDPNDLAIRTILNGQVMQDANTADMIFDIRTLVAFLSADTTLLPKTVILTGTPHGIGAARTPPVYLKAGDEVAIEIERIGRLTNPVVDAGSAPGQGLS